MKAGNVFWLSSEPGEVASCTFKLLLEPEGCIFRLLLEPDVVAGCTFRLLLEPGVVARLEPGVVASCFRLLLEPGVVAGSVFRLLFKPCMSAGRLSVQVRWLLELCACVIRPLEHFACVFVKLEVLKE